MKCPTCQIDNLPQFIDAPGCFYCVACRVYWRDSAGDSAAVQQSRDMIDECNRLPTFKVYSRGAHVCDGFKKISAGEIEPYFQVLTQESARYADSVNSR